MNEEIFLFLLNPGYMLMFFCNMISLILLLIPTLLCISCVIFESKGKCIVYYTRDLLHVLHVGYCCKLSCWNNRCNLLIKESIVNSVCPSLGSVKPLCCYTNMLSHVYERFQWCANRPLLMSCTNTCIDCPPD